jgi:hypothetical protein
VGALAAGHDGGWKTTERGRLCSGMSLAFFGEMDPEASGDGVFLTLQNEWVPRCSLYFQNAEGDHLIQPYTVTPVSILALGRAHNCINQTQPN